MNDRIAVGIDIGGSKTAFAKVAVPEGRILARSEIPTPPAERTGAAFVAEVARTAREMVDDAAVGISICELVGLEGNVRSAHRVHWQGLDLADHFPTPPHIEADVRAAAIAEARIGAGRPFRQFLYVNLGTGISSCWMSGGEPHRGARGSALVLGTGPISLRCPHCGKPVRQVAEDVAGAAALAALYPGASSAREVLEAAAAGEPRAIRIVSDAAHALASAIGLAAGILDPEALVLGGGLAADRAFLARLEGEIRAHIWSPDTRKLPILPAALGADSALVGAALAAAQGMSSPKLR